MIGAFSAVMFAAFGMFARSLRSELDARFERVDARFDGLTDVMNARLADVDHRLESLETDMHLVKAHLIGHRSA